MQHSMIWMSTAHPGGGEQKYIDDAFNKGRLFAFGENKDGFEADLEHYLGNGNYVAALNSGTAAIHLALILMGVGPGDEVICQSLTFAASANPIVYLGATPVFVGSEPQTWNICPDALETAIKNRIAAGKKPKAIIAVHLYGMPYKVKEVHEISAKYGVPVLEDSAEALGSTYFGQKCGTFGDIAVLSFNGNKIITTSSGGAIVCKNPDDKKKALYFATQAKDPVPHYQHSSVGYNYSMSNILAGIGRGQMEVLEDRILKRRQNNIFYRDLFEALPVATVFSSFDEKGFYSNYWLTVAVFKREGDNILLMEHLRKENIESRPVFKPLHLQPVFKQSLYFGNEVAENIYNSGLCLPSGSNFTDAERERVAESIYRWYKENP